MTAPITCARTAGCSRSTRRSARVLDSPRSALRAALAACLSDCLVDFWASRSACFAAFAAALSAFLSGLAPGRRCRFDDRDGRGRGIVDDRDALGMGLIEVVVVARVPAERPAEIEHRQRRVGLDRVVADVVRCRMPSHGYECVKRSPVFARTARHAGLG